MLHRVRLLPLLSILVLTASAGIPAVHAGLTPLPSLITESLRHSQPGARKINHRANAPKGTIGLVCYDNEGVAHTWNAAPTALSEGKDFDHCMKEVMSQWQAGLEEEGATDVNLEEFLGGYSTFRYRERELRTRMRNGEPPVEGIDVPGQSCTELSCR